MQQPRRLGTPQLPLHPLDLLILLRVIELHIARRRPVLPIQRNGLPSISLINSTAITNVAVELGNPTVLEIAVLLGAFSVDRLSVQSVLPRDGAPTQAVLIASADLASFTSRHVLPALDERLSRIDFR